MLLFLAVAQHESGNIETIYWSMTVNNKDVYSKCNLTVQIEPDKEKGGYTISVDNRNNTYLTNNNLFLSFNSDHPCV